MLSHTRIFSALGRYQAAHSLTYSMWEEQGAQRLSLCKCGQAGSKTQTALAAIPLQEAELVLRYLYENAVPQESWLDILEDLLPEGSLKRE